LSVPGAPATRPPTAQAAARDLLERLKIMPLPVPYKSKNPNRPGWEQERVTLEELPERFDGARLNVGGMWGEPSGGAVDVDLDCPQVKRTAARFLPETAAVYGHAGSRRSHALYRCAGGTTPARTRRWKDVDGKTLVELRSTGGHSLAPGSVHPDGYFYEWDAPGEPATVDGRELGRLVARSAAAALLARHWPVEGGRHDAAGALAGALARQGWPDAEVLAFVDAVLEASGDDEPEDRRRFTAETLENGRGGRQTTGWPSLAQAVSDAVATRARGWLGVTGQPDGAPPDGAESPVGPERRNGHAPAPPREAPPVEPKTLAEVVATFKQWLHLDDLGPLYAVLATVVANRMAGDPVWLMVVGASSGGKTELVNAISREPDVHPAATLTEASLLSGTPKKDRRPGAKGGLLREIGDFGILAVKDFTSILSMNREPRTQLLGALREIFDGAWHRDVGVEGGTRLAWEGKVGLVAGCTAVVDSHHQVMATMGERFLLYRLGEIDPKEQARRALQNTGRERQLRAELAGAVSGLFASLAPLPEGPPDLADAETDGLVALASLAARARSGVERDAHTREIELIPDPEAPARLAQTLRRLYGGMLTIGLERAAAWGYITKVGLDCMPKLRRGVFDALAALPAGARLGTGVLAAQVAYPTTTARRALEDLMVHGVVEREAEPAGGSHNWWLTRWAREQFVGAMTVPEMSVPLRGERP